MKPDYNGKVEARKEITGSNPTKDQGTQNGVQSIRKMTHILRKKKQFV